MCEQSVGAEMCVGLELRGIGEQGQILDCQGFQC